MASRVAWIGLHPLQQGLAIAGLNGVQSVLMCSDSTRSGSKWGLTPCVPMTNSEFGLLVAIFTLGGLFASAASRAILTRFGVVGTLRWSALAVMLGSAVLVVGESVGVMVAARVMIGIGCGFSTTTTPLALAAVAPAPIRQSLGIVNQFSIVLGIVIGQALSFPFGSPWLWRWIPAVSVVFGVVQLWGSLGVGRIVIEDEEEEEQGGAGGAVLVAEETAPLLDSGPRDKKQPLTIPELFATNEDRVVRALPLVLICQAAQQFCGISAVMYFSTSILSPVFPSSAKAAALALVLFKISLTALPAFIVERTGTKPLMLYPTALMSVSLVVLAVGINTNTPVAAIAGIMAFVAAFSQGPGPITWVVLATALPPHARAAASAVALSINWLCSFVVGVAFLPLQAYLAGSRGQQGDVFYVFAFLCAVSVVGVWAGYRRLEAA